MIIGDINTADQSVDTADWSVDTAEQSFDIADWSVDTADSIDIPNKAEEIPPFTAEENIKFAHRYEEGDEHPNELDNDESMYNHQLLCNDTEPNDCDLISNDCLDTSTFTELKYATRLEEA